MTFRNRRRLHKSTDASLALDHPSFRLLVGEPLRSPSSPYHHQTHLNRATSSTTTTCFASRSLCDLRQSRFSESSCPLNKPQNSDTTTFNQIQTNSSPFHLSQSSAPFSDTSNHTIRSEAPSPSIESDGGIPDDSTISPPTIRLKLPLSSSGLQLARPSELSHGRLSARVGIQRLTQLFSPLTAARSSSSSTKKTGDPQLEKPKNLSGSDKTLGQSSTIRAPTPNIPAASLEVRRRASATSWRSTISEYDYRRVLTHYGPDEIHRQQIIWELLTTEIDFIEDLSKILNLFANPLRQTWNRGWMSGIPTAVSELFEELDSILKVHQQIHSAVLQLVHNTPKPPILQFAHLLLPLIPNLRVYERYLIIFEPVTRLLESHLASSHEDSRFGEFLRIQSVALKTVGKLNLVSFLLKPVQRLMKYPLFFRELSERSPSTHPDHLPILELLKLTDQAIREMQSAKATQETHATMKVIEANLRGLPSGFVLATCGRRVICEGAVSRLTHLSGRLESGRGRSKSLAPNMLSPINRPPSLDSDLSEWNHSFKSLETASSGSNSTFWDANSDPADLGSVSPAADPLSTSNSPPPYSFNSRSSAAGSSTSSSYKKVSSPYVFVMNDMVVFAEPIRKTKKRPLYRILDRIGLSRVLNVSLLISEASAAKYGEDLPPHQPHLEIELEPLYPNPNFVHSRKIDSNLSTSTIIVHLTLASNSHLLKNWYQAFQSSMLGNPSDLQSGHLPPGLVQVFEETRHYKPPAAAADPHHSSLPVIRQLRGRARSLFTLSAGGSHKRRPSDHFFDHEQPPPPPPPLPSLPDLNSLQSSVT